MAQGDGERITSVATFATDAERLMSGRSEGALAA
jgi:hypothetical protein